MIVSSIEFIWMCSTCSVVAEMGWRETKKRSILNDPSRWHKRMHCGGIWHPSVDWLDSTGTDGWMTDVIWCARKGSLHFVEYMKIFVLNVFNIRKVWAMNSLSRNDLSQKETECFMLVHACDISSPTRVYEAVAVGSNIRWTQVSQVIHA